MKMQFWAFNTTTAKSRKCHLSGKQGTIDRVFQAVLAVQEFRFFSVSYKKLYRTHPVEFLITAFFLKSDLFLKIEFLKGGTLLYSISCHEASIMVV